MPERRLEVHMDGDHAGTLTMSSSGALTFGYDDDYRFAPGATPLSLSMPKSTGRHRQRAVLPFVQGLLPDNPQALGSLASSYQVSARSPFALLEHVGHDVAGALQFVVPGETSEDAAADRSAVDTISDDEVAAALAEVIEVYRTGRPLRGGERLRISLAGAQPKIALVLTPDGWARPRRGAPTTHILKPEYRTPRSLTDERFPNLVTVEMFSLAVAATRGSGCRTRSTGRRPTVICAPSSWRGTTASSGRTAWCIAPTRRTCARPCRCHPRRSTSTMTVAPVSARSQSSCAAA